VNEAILTGASAAEFARHHEIELLARQIAMANCPAWKHSKMQPH
jgi:hypothetical protein